jgi:tRNA(Ile)-lysidine synthase
VTTSANQLDALTDAEADAAFSLLASYDHVILAVSGGPDSLAMMVLVAAWSQRRPEQGPTIRVATVDHKLRAQSAAEAAFVGTVAAQLGLPHATLDWDGEKPASGLADAARRARYELLEAYASTTSTPGSCAIVTAHTEDDQAETLVMRLKRGGGVEALASIPVVRPISPSSAVALVRPLLGVSKMRLFATLRARGLSWCEDPSNSNPRAERVQARGALAALNNFGVNAPALALSARRMREASDALDYATRGFIATLALQMNDGVFARLDRQAFDAGPAALRQRVLKRLIAHFGGTTQAPDALEIDGLALRISGAEEIRTTLGGATFSVGPRALRVWREFGRIAPEPLQLVAGQRMLWDDRFWVAVGPSTDPAQSFEGSVSVGALGQSGFGTIAARLPRERVVPAAAAHALPAFWTGDMLIGVPLLGVGPPAGAQLAALSLTCDPLDLSIA